MPGLRARIVRHGRHREVPCVLCGDFHEQQLVAVALFENHRHLGDVCATCLTQQPTQTAERARDYAAYLTARAQDLHRHIVRTLAIVESDQKEYPHLSQRLEADWRLVRQHARHLVRVLEDQVNLQTSLVEALRRLEKWSITTADVCEAERSELRKKFPELSEADWELILFNRSSL